MKLPIETFAVEMRAMAQVFNTEVTAVMSEVYYRRFDGWTSEQFSGACSRCLSELTFFPKPNEISARFPSHVPNHKPAEAQKMIAQSAPSNEEADTLDNVVEKMTDEEVTNTLEQSGLSDQTAHQLLAVFRREPRGNIRGYLKDCLCPDWDIQNEPRFHCPQCQDRGSLEVYAREDIEKALKQGKNRIGEVPTKTCACSCSRSARFKRPIQAEEFNRCAPLRGIETADRRADLIDRSAPIGAIPENVGNVGETS